MKTTMLDRDFQKMMDTREAERRHAAQVRNGVTYEDMQQFLDEAIDDGDDESVTLFRKAENGDRIAQARIGAYIIASKRCGTWS